MAGGYPKHAAHQKLHEVWTIRVLEARRRRKMKKRREKEAEKRKFEERRKIAERREISK